MNENEKTMVFAKMCDLEALFTTISSRLNSALFSRHLPFSIFEANEVTYCMYHWTPQRG